MLRGAMTGDPRLELFPGNLDLNESHPLPKLSGLLTFTPGFEIVLGDDDTEFRDEVAPGQHILAGGELLAVKEVMSDSAFTVYRAPSTGATDVVGHSMPQMSEMDGRRVVMTTGNAVKNTRGHIFATGRGTLKVNGQPLAGESLVLSERPRIAIYRRETNDYVVRDLGYSAPPPKPDIRMVAGGTKGLKHLTKRSFLVSWWSGEPEGTGGFSDPTDPIRTDPDGEPLEIVSDDATDRTKFQFDFTASLVDPPDNAMGFIIWQSMEGKETIGTPGATTYTESPNEGNYQNGPWFRAANVLFTDLETGDLYEIEVLDRELGAEVTGDNDRLPACEYIVKAGDRLLLISCFGPNTTADGDEGNPGPSVIITKADNLDAAPLEWRASAANTILGWLKDDGGWFLLTSGGIERATLTGLYGQTSEGGRVPELPILTRPFWETGAANRYSIARIDRFLIGRSGGKFVRSTSEGDSLTKAYDFGAVVEDLTKGWNDGHVLVGDDSQNAQVCFFHSAAYKNAAGYWVTEILPFTLFGVWMPKIVLSSNAQDMIVSGVAKVNNHLEFLCGGRVGETGYGVRTYRFAEGSVPPGENYLLWQPSDDGTDAYLKEVHALRPLGRLTSPVVQIHGSRPGGSLSIENMENGTAAADSTAYFSGDIVFPTTDKITDYLPKRMRLKRLSNYAVRISTSWTGGATPDRLEELVVEYSYHGRPR